MCLALKSQRYITDSDPEEDPKEDPINYPADKGDDDDDDDESSDDVEDNDDDLKEDKEDDHPASADSIPPLIHRVTARMYIREQPPIPFWSEAEIARLLAIPSPSPSPLSLWSSPLPQITSSPLPVTSPVLVSPPPLPASPTYPLGYRAAMIRLRAETPSTSHLLLLSTPPSRTPPILPIPLSTPSPPLLLPFTDCRAGVFEVTLPPQKRADYGFVATLDDEIRRDPERDDTDEIYGRLDDAQDDRLLMSVDSKRLLETDVDPARTA
ncbi:hypothetical protein Tco_1044181 [Tanacetum coccineum]|uniref:Uncharacterized protein n=1 Tax=Tanacetum coccineum TaxID=301880 RepID=A0ABQ5GQE9_9ASTR